jgi:hypothetical protein
VKLWYHECSRVFHDRLIDDIDKKTFLGFLETEFSNFKVKKDEILE